MVELGMGIKRGAVLLGSLFALVLLAAAGWVASAESADDSILTFVEQDHWRLADGTELAVPELAASADLTKSSWSPDGSELAYACNPETLEPFVDGHGLCSASGDQATLWTEAFAPIRFPVWSSDGGQLAYAALGEEGHGSLWVVERHGSGISETLCEDWCPLFRYYSLAWSPDGDTLAAVAETPGTGGHPARVILFDVDTHEFNFLAQDLPGLQHGPTWSPDGTELAFSSTAEGDFDLWSVELDSREARRLTEEAGGAVNATWSPSGDEIVFVSRADGGGTTLRSVPANGGDSTEVVGPGQVRAPQFLAAR